MKALMREPVTVACQPLHITISAAELEESLRLGLLERAKEYRRMRDHARKEANRLLNDGPDGESNPYRNVPDSSPYTGRMTAWNDMIDGWMRREREAQQMASALEALHDQMTDR